LEEARHMNQPKKKRPVAWILLVLAVCVMTFSGYKLWEINNIYLEGNQSYEQLAAMAQTPALSFGGAQNPPASPSDNAPDINIDFTVLKSINQDAAAWLYCPDTAINYPVMRAKDYDWYLHHLPDGTANANGSLFLDYNNPGDFSGRLNIIYGHNMKSGKMLGSLSGYKNQSYFEKHPYIFLYTQQKSYTAELLYGCVVDAGKWSDRAFMYETNLPSLLSYAKSNSTFQSGAAYSEQDSFLVLSTCSYEFDDARYVVIGVLRPQ
jgi:sortase B